MRNFICELIGQSYGESAERIFDKHPDFAVFRHSSNGKWFAVLMQVNGDKIGLNSKKEYEILNLKCSPDLAMILRDESTILPAYHMNKKHWISVVLNEISKEKLIDLIDESYNLTKQGKRSGK